MARTVARAALSRADTSACETPHPRRHEVGAQTLPGCAHCPLPLGPSLPDSLLSSSSSLLFLFHFLFSAVFSVPLTSVL